MSLTSCESLLGSIVNTEASARNHAFPSLDASFSHCCTLYMYIDPTGMRAAFRGGVTVRVPGTSSHAWIQVQTLSLENRGSEQMAQLAGAQPLRAPNPLLSGTAAKTRPPCPVCHPSKWLVNLDPCSRTEQPQARNTLSSGSWEGMHDGNVSSGGNSAARIIASV